MESARRNRGNVTGGSDGSTSEIPISNVNRGTHIYVTHISLPCPFDGKTLGTYSQEYFPQLYTASRVTEIPTMVWLGRSERGIDR